MSHRLDQRRGKRREPPLGSSPDYRWNALPSADRVRVVAGAASWDGASE